MSSEPLIRLKNVSKQYLVYAQPEDRLKQMLIPRFSRMFGTRAKQYHRAFSAVSDISLDVGRGETIGIVGRNGSGKSTLLQMICGTLEPTSGTIEVRGRIAALLELGSGFNPEFTGRENVFLNAAILGLSTAETEARFDKIAAFADIGPFLDQPVKTYSSGMFVRLAFAVATSIEPDILIVDEALSVGDEAFQRKCFNRIETIKNQGGTILFVSHGAQTVVQLCDRAILIDRGEKLLEGRPKVVINHYQRLMNLSGADAEAAREALKSVDGWLTETFEEDATVPSGARPAASDGTLAREWFDPKLVSASQVEYSPKGARILDVHITNAAGERVNNLVLNEKYFYRYEVEFDTHMAGVNFAMFVKTINGVEIAGQQAFAYDQHITVEPGDRYSVSFPFDCPFLPATYSCNCGVFTRTGNDLSIRHRILDAILFRVMPADARYSRQGIIDLCPDNEPVSVEVKAFRKTA